MNIQFSSRAWEDYLYWQQFDKRVLEKTNELLQDIARSPHDGIGKPEPLSQRLLVPPHH